MAKATSVQAANAIPLVSNTVAVRTFMSSGVQERLEEPGEQLAERPGQDRDLTPSSASLAIASRTRPMPCVQAYR